MEPQPKVTGITWDLAYKPHTPPNQREAHAFFLFDGRWYSQFTLCGLSVEHYLDDRAWGRKGRCKDCERLAKREQKHFVTGGAA